MVPPMFTYFLLILIFLLLRFSSGHAQQVSVKKSMVVANTRTGVKHETPRTSSVNLEEMSEIDERTRFDPGRKVMSRGASKVVESEHWIAETSSSDGESQHEGKGIANMKRRFSERSRDSVNVKMSGFVSWNADYHVPRPHPPKNN